MSVVIMESLLYALVIEQYPVFLWTSNKEFFISPKIIAVIPISIISSSMAVPRALIRDQGLTVLSTVQKKRWFLAPKN